MIDIEKYRELAASLRGRSTGRMRWYAMGLEEKSYFIDFDSGIDADDWMDDQQKRNPEWVEREGIHIVQQMSRTELEESAGSAADVIDALLVALENVERERDGLRAARIAYATEFPPDAEGEPDVGNIHANIRKLKADVVASSADTHRLNYLDRLNASLNRHYGTTYQWKLILSPNIVRLMSGRQQAGYVGDIDLNDASADKGASDSCRGAIDAAMKQRGECRDDLPKIHDPMPDAQHVHTIRGLSARAVEQPRRLEVPIVREGKCAMAGALRKLHVWRADRNHRLGHDVG